MPNYQASPDLKIRAHSTTPLAISKSTAQTDICWMRGCCWRGKCPAHTAKYPRGYKSTDRLTRLARQPEIGTRGAGRE